MGWQQQFDLTLLDEAIETFAPKTVERSFYRYWTGIGWQVSRAEDCASCHYAPWGDHGLFGYQVTPVSEPVAAEAIACVALTR
jgi:hypothetical protein